MRRTLALLTGLVTAHTAPAQDWATREVCFSDPQPVTAADVVPHDLDRLEAEAAQIANSVGRLWRIESTDGAVSHLWGTMHNAHPQVLDLPEALELAIRNARLVAVEIDFTYPDRATMATRYNEPERYREATNAFLPEDPLDLSYLGADVEAAVFDRIGGGDYGEELLYIMTYAGLAEHLLADPCEDFTTGVIPHQDTYIQTLAHISGAELTGLEDPSDFIKDLANDPGTAKAIIATYAAYLPAPTRTENFNAAVQLYLEGRIGLMATWEAAHLKATYGAYGATALKGTDDYLITHRNKRFLTRIAPELATGDAVIAVGTFHLPGENGLVEMLRREGYTVTRLALPGEAP